MDKRSMLKRITIYSILLCIMLSVTSCSSQGVTSAKWGNAGNGENAAETSDFAKTEDEDGSYLIDITLEGGSGKAYIESPAEITALDGKITAKLVWSSKNYDYMIVNGERYENENPGGASTFNVVIDDTSEPLTVIADTVAMSTPHEIEYVITWGERRFAGQDKSDADNKPDSNPSGKGTGKKDSGDSIAEEKRYREAVKESLEAAGIEYKGKYELEYAVGFTIDRYEGYDHLQIPGSGDYLIVSKDKEIPGGLPENVVILKKPLNRTYLVSTSAMDLVNACGALDKVRLSGTKESDWYIDAAKKAMQDNKIIYAGKYSAPDYELILENGCSLAIENTMIYHEPAVKEKLEELGIPVLVETSSYEPDPVARLEWIKLYGVLFDREKEAEEFFDRQLSIIEPFMKEKPDTGKKVAFFYVTAGGLINVRIPGDYITDMIGLSGGDYVPDIKGDEDGALSTMNMQMEDFYEKASDADVIIYSSTIGGTISSIDELTEKNPLFKDFKAVKESKVYCTGRDLFQKTTGVAQFMQDLNAVLNETEREYTFLFKVD
ncbi:MAG: ABC transporter substrate-binding protein [Lachnospiraceae bacterium]|nr:ABC transporter substrate-binding protein [Lachnospiraceae bacterium]